MADLLPLGLGRPGVIISGLCSATRLMGWAHIVEGVGAPELKGANVLDYPALAHAIDPLIADDAGAAGSLPSLETPAG